MIGGLRRNNKKAKGLPYLSPGQRPGLEMFITTSPERAK